MWKRGLVGLVAWGMSGCGDDGANLNSALDGGSESGHAIHDDAGFDSSAGQSSAAETSQSSAVETGQSGVRTTTSDTTTSNTMTNVSGDAAIPETTSADDASSSSDADPTSSLHDVDASADSGGVVTSGSDDAGTGTNVSTTNVEDGGIGVGSGSTDPEDGGAPNAIEARAGFIDIEASQYVFAGNPRQKSSARLFYAFTPADELPEEAPIFVFFNGGPGAATSSALMSFGTGNYSLPADLSAPTLETNPWSWAKMGNLLYFDTRQAGFSYSTLEDPSDADARSLEWEERNFNLYVDAADAVRLLLRVLSREPQLRDNPIVLVGESYGGTRATIMLLSLLDPAWLRPPTLFEDLALADEIEEFFELNIEGPAHTIAEQAKSQLPAQVLIQPFFAGDQFLHQQENSCLPGTPAAEVAAELDISCSEVMLFRDPYKIDEPTTWSSTLLEIAQQTLMHPTKLSTLLGVELDDIRGLRADERPNAFRDTTVGWADPQPEFAATLGELQPWDAYHLTQAGGARWSDTIYSDPNPCYLFPWVAQQVNTFMTNAKWDIVVLTPLLPATLFGCSHNDPFLDSVGFASDELLPMGESGQMVLQFNESAPEGASETSIEIKGYDSGHLVTVTHGQELFVDVQAFLAERGVL